MLYVDAHMLDGRRGKTTLTGINPYVVYFDSTRAKEYLNWASAQKGLNNRDLGIPVVAYYYSNNVAAELQINVGADGRRACERVWQEASLPLLISSTRNLREKALYVSADGTFTRGTIAEMIEAIVNAAPNRAQALWKLVPGASIRQKASFIYLRRLWDEDADTYLFYEIEGLVRVITGKEAMIYELERHFQNSDEQPPEFTALDPYSGLNSLLESWCFGVTEVTIAQRQQDGVIRPTKVPIRRAIEMAAAGFRNGESMECESRLNGKVAKVSRSEDGQLVLVTPHHKPRENYRPHRW